MSGDPGGSGSDAFEEKYGELEELHDRPPIRRSRRRRAARGKRSPGKTGDELEGVILSRSRGKFRVRLVKPADCEGEVVPCFIRGTLAGVAAPVVGDRVRLSRNRQGRGVLEEVLPRKNSLPRVSEEDPREVRTLAANIDLLAIILAVDPFPPRWVLADRLLALAELERIDAVIVVNKIDLLDDASRERRELDQAMEVYRDIGVRCLLTSATRGDGLGGFRSLLVDCVSVLGGHSGVGKSSLLNALLPELELHVGEVNPLTGKGRHTTTLARLVELPSGGFLVDTPGFREFGLGDLAPAELGRCYPEFRPFIGHCRFTDCLHLDEPDCALRAAVDRGKVSNFRYANYLQILSGLLETR